MVIIVREREVRYLIGEDSGMQGRTAGLNMEELKVMDFEKKLYRKMMVSGSS